MRRHRAWVGQPPTHRSTRSSPQRPPARRARSSRPGRRAFASSSRRRAPRRGAASDDRPEHGLGRGGRTEADDEVARGHDGGQVGQQSMPAPEREARSPRRSSVATTRAPLVAWVRARGAPHRPGDTMLDRQSRRRARARSGVSHGIGSSLSTTFVPVWRSERSANACRIVFEHGGRPDGLVAPGRTAPARGWVWIASAESATTTFGWLRVTPERRVVGIDPWERTHDVDEDDHPLRPRASMPADVVRVDAGVRADARITVR